MHSKTSRTRWKSRFTDCHFLRLMFECSNVSEELQGKVPSVSTSYGTKTVNSLHVLQKWNFGHVRSLSTIFFSTMDLFLHFVTLHKHWPYLRHWKMDYRLPSSESKREKIWYHIDQGSFCRIFAWITDKLIELCFSQSIRQEFEWSFERWGIGHYLHWSQYSKSYALLYNWRLFRMNQFHKLNATTCGEVLMFSFYNFEIKVWAFCTKAMNDNQMNTAVCNRRQSNSNSMRLRAL